MAFGYILGPWDVAPIFLSCIFANFWMSSGLLQHFHENQEEEIATSVGFAAEALEKRISRMSMWLPTPNNHTPVSRTSLVDLEDEEE